jgi:predicted ATP-grasp superfamily ATP-dependent carboligase
VLELTRYYTAGRAIKRLCVNRDPFWLRPWWNGTSPAICVQAYIQGRPANSAVVCWKGRVLAGIGVEVVSAAGSTGPASVVRVVDNPVMTLSAERIAARLRLSGFFSLDFMIEDGSGLTYLIEMNPRPTRVSCLRLGKGRDLIGALCAQLSGQPYQETPPVTQKNMIAYFPDAQDSNDELVEASFHDTPEGEPELVREFLKPWPPRGLFWHLFSQANRMKMFLRGSDSRR